MSLEISEKKILISFDMLPAQERLGNSRETLKDQCVNEML